MRFNHPASIRTNPLQERAIKEALLALYALCGAKKEDHLLFTSSGAESVNHAIFSAYLDITRKTGKNHFLCSYLDEAPTIMAMSRLQECNCLFQMIPATSQGIITKEGVAQMLSPRTAMVSMSWANGLTGVIQPVLDIAQLCQERGILFHVDATHVLGKGDFVIDECGADLISFDGPLGGSGFLLIREGKELSPFILGGSQQGGMRGGEYNAQLLIDCGRWAKEQKSNSDHYGMEMARLRALFEEKMCQMLPDAIPLFRETRRMPHLCSFIFPGVTSDALYYTLLQKGIYSSIGGGHFQHISHILKACKIEQPDCHCAISFSFYPTIEEDEILRDADVIKEAVLHLKKYSQYILEPV